MRTPTIRTSRADSPGPGLRAEIWGPRQNTRSSELVLFDVKTRRANPSWSDWDGQEKDGDLRREETSPSCDNANAFRDQLCGGRQFPEYETCIQPAEKESKIYQLYTGNDFPANLHGAKSTQFTIRKSQCSSRWHAHWP